MGLHLFQSLVQQAGVQNGRWTSNLKPCSVHINFRCFSSRFRTEMCSALGPYSTSYCQYLLSKNASTSVFSITPDIKCIYLSKSDPSSDGAAFNSSSAANYSNITLEKCSRQTTVVNTLSTHAVRLARVPLCVSSSSNWP